MTPETGLTATAVDPQISGAMAVFDRLAPLKDALGVKDLTEPELQLFAMVAYQTGLDPFTKQIYAIKRNGKVTHQTGIDGYRSVAERTGQYAGSDEATYEDCPCEKKPSPHPSVARVTVHRILANGHVVDQVGIARWHELVPTDDFMWRQMPLNQLAKCAEANGLRKAFPRVLGGVYIEEEMQQAGPAENPALVAAASQPTARQRLAARREAVEATDALIIDQKPATAESGGLDRAFDDEPLPPTPTNVDRATGEVLEPRELTREEFTALARAAGYDDLEVIKAALARTFPGRLMKDLAPVDLGVLADAMGLVA